MEKEEIIKILTLFFFAITALTYYLILPKFELSIHSKEKNNNKQNKSHFTPL